LAAALLALAPILADASARLDRPAAVLGGLDKYSGAAESFTAEVGRATPFHRLEVTVRACRTADDDLEDAAAFLEIVDARNPDRPAFSGWMFSRYPAAAALDHPRYDVWVAACSTESAEAS
jgi:hypothetical protein